MTRRPTPILFDALVAIALLAAAPLQAQEPEPAEPMPQETASPAVGERVERAEEGAITGRIVLLDADNLIVETADGDRAFSIREDSTLPDELRRSEDWASFRGVPVRISFAPGDEGELRVVRTVTLVGGDTPAAPTEPVAERPFATRTDLADESDVVEPSEIEPAPGTADTELAADDVDEPMPAERTTAQEIAAANPDADDDDLAATGLVDDDELPPADDTLASLPATASPLPWLALIGTLALAGALGLGRLQRRRQRVPATRR